MVRETPKWIARHVVRRILILFLMITGLMLERIVEMPFRIAMAIDQLGRKGTVRDE